MVATFDSSSGCSLIFASLFADEPVKDRQTKKHDIPADALARVTRSAVAKIHPSVVTVVPYGGTSEGGTYAPSKNQGKPKPPQQRKPRSAPSGSGARSGVIFSEDGYIFTSALLLNRHPQGFSVVFANGQRLLAKLVAADEDSMLALLKVELPKGQKLVAPEMVPWKKVQLGQWALSYGHGFGGLKGKGFTSLGIVSALDRLKGSAIQTDANFSPACYGGALIDLEGRLLGICSAASPSKQRGGFQIYDAGVGFAIHSDALKKLYNKLIKQ